MWKDEAIAAAPELSPLQKGREHVRAVVASIVDLEGRVRSLVLRGSTGDWIRTREAQNHPGSGECRKVGI